jgi:hypothetical protein
MRFIRNLLFILIPFFLFGLRIYAQPAVKETEVIYAYDNNPKLDWFRDAGFGHFIHWGRPASQG